MNSPIGFRWLGVAGIELNRNNQILAIDPFFTRPPFGRLWLGRVSPDSQSIAEKMPKCDIILVTHAHWDHIMDVPEVVRNTGAVVAGSANTCRILEICGVPGNHINQVGVGDKFTFGHFQVEVLPAEHIHLPGFAAGVISPNLQPLLRLRDYRMDSCFNFLIEVDGFKMLVWSGLHPEPAPQAEVLFVGSGGKPDYYRSLLARVQPRILVPIHWDDFFRPLSKPLWPFFGQPRWALPPLSRLDMDRFTRMIRQIGDTRVFIPEIFQTYELRSL